MFCKISSGAIFGLNAYPIQVEADISNGLPSFSMVGLLSSEVREARERVKTAIKNSGFTVPPKRIIINLSPADIRKEGSFYDLPIAVAILVSMGIVSPGNMEDNMFLGELSLDGEVKKVNGILSITMMAKEKGYKRIFVPRDNSREGAIVNDVEVVGIKSLSEVVKFLNNPELIEPEYVDLKSILYIEEKESDLDFDEVIGQEAVKRATEIAAAGMHNILYIGTPGSGKTMIAKRIPTILPSLALEEIIEIIRIYSILGLLNSESRRIQRPFRAPHHTVTPQALAGGGRFPKPGEMTLAHKGVLFLDELPEYSRKTIETLRQPMEEQKITINREKYTYEFPADCMIVAAMNPCPCGYYPDRSRCNCTPYNIERYTNKIKGALLDRIDICVQTSKIEIGELQSTKRPESSADIRKRVEDARAVQKERYKNSNICYNSRLEPGDIEKYCRLSKKEQELLIRTCDKLKLSMRAYHNIIKVARTIADLDGSVQINKNHILEATAYRNSFLNKGDI